MKDLLTIKEVAEAAGITQQAVYKQLNNKLKDYVVELNNKKMLKVSALEEVYGIKSIQPVEQQVDNFIKPVEQPDSTTKLLADTLETLKKQIEQKDIQLAEKDKQIIELTKSIQFEQGKTKELADKLFLLEQKEETEATTDVVEPVEAEEKKSWFKRLFS